MLAEHGRGQRERERLAKEVRCMVITQCSGGKGQGVCVRVTEEKQK